MTKNKVIGRIRKLLALSTSSNKNEAATASAHARRLMERHGLTEADVTDASEDGMMFELSMGAVGFGARWKFILVAAVAQAFHCDVVGLRSAKRRKVRMVGLKEDTEVAARIFKYLLMEIEKLVRSESRNPPDELVIEVALGVEQHSYRTYLDSFRRGAVSAIMENLERSEHVPTHPSSKTLTVTESRRSKAKDYIKSKFTETRYFSLDGSRNEIDDLAFIRGYDLAMGITMPKEVEAHGANSPSSPMEDD